MPNSTWNQFDFIGDSEVGDFEFHRQTYHAMVYCERAMQPEGPPLPAVLLSHARPFLMLGRFSCSAANAVV